MKRALLFAALAALAGCASVNVCREGATMVDIQNTGWYLFDCIPLASGSPANPNGHTCRPFQDTVTVENNMKMLDYAMRREGAAGCRHLSSYTTDESVFFILLTRFACHTSAQLIKEPAPCASPNP